MKIYSFGNYLGMKFVYLALLITKICTNMKNFSLFTVLFCLLSLNVFAQDKCWEVDLKDQLVEVGWIEQTNDGLILASGAKGLLAMDNNSGEVLWHNEDLKSVDKNSFLNISNLPLFYVEYSPIVGKTRGVIMNSSTGEILLDTKDENYKVKGYTEIPDQGMILFELVKDKTRYVMNFSLRTWDQAWITPVGANKSGLMKKVFSDSYFITHAPQFDNNGNMIIGIDDMIYVIRVEDGSIAWDYTAKKDIKALVYSPVSNGLYVGVKKSNKLIVFDPATGNDITPGKLKLRGSMIDLVEGNGNDLILIETEGFNILDPSTNELQWKKSYKMEPLNEVIPMADGYIAIGKSEKNGGIDRVDLKGKKVWDAKIKGYAYYVTLTDNGVLYVSNERANVLDFNKGKDVWKKDVKFRAIPAVTYDTDANKVILFENGNGYKFDMKSGDIELFAENIDLEKVNKSTPLSAEYIPSVGYFIFTDQHLSLLTPDGQLIYTKYYNPAKSNDALVGIASMVGKAYLGADFDVEGNIDNIKMLNNMSKGVYRTTSDQHGGQRASTVSGLYTGSDAANMQPVFEVTSNRHFNSQQTQDYQFVVTSDARDASSTKHQILMINKATGEIEKEIDLMDKTPNYEIDVVDNKVFVNEKNHLISCYKF